jgi:hypothetical protein
MNFVHFGTNTFLEFNLCPRASATPEVVAFREMCLIAFVVFQAVDSKDAEVELSTSKGFANDHFSDLWWKL